MPHLNVEVDETTVANAKEASQRAGMLLRKWVERAVNQTAEAEKPKPPTATTAIGMNLD